MDVKFEFYDLNNLCFDAKHIQFGYIWSQIVHKEVCLEVEWNKRLKQVWRGSFVSGYLIGREIDRQPITNVVSDE